MVSDERREQIAEIVYDAFPYDGEDAKPPWRSGGNSFMQDRARQAALAILALAAQQDVRDVMEALQRWYRAVHHGSREEEAIQSELLAKAYSDYIDRDPVGDVITGLRHRWARLARCS